jgi:uncharacterized protein (TIGR02996 family)
MQQDTTSDLDALYRAILANPAEDTPRLMFADELDSIGGQKSAGRAKVIRLSIELEWKYGAAWRNGWVEKHLFRNWKEWWTVPKLYCPAADGLAAAELVPWDNNIRTRHEAIFNHFTFQSTPNVWCNYTFSRGFFSRARVPWHHWEMFGDTIVKHVPIASVELLTAPAYTHEMFQSVGGISTWAAQSGVDFYHKIFDKTEVECHTANYHKWATMELLRTRWPTVAEWQLPSP